MKKKSIILSLIVTLIIGLYFIISYLKNETGLIKVEHVFNARVERIWKIWNNPDSVRQWWGPKGYTSPEAKIDFREGGTYILSMMDSKGKISWNKGIYKKIIPNEKIYSRIFFSDENGNVVPATHYGIPGNWPNGNNLSVEFVDMGEKTKVIVEEHDIPLIMHIFAKMGWNQQFEKFEELLD